MHTLLPECKGVVLTTENIHQSLSWSDITKLRDLRLLVARCITYPHEGVPIVISAMARWGVIVHRLQEGLFVLLRL